MYLWWHIWIRLWLRLWFWSWSLWFGSWLLLWLSDGLAIVDVIDRLTTLASRSIRLWLRWRCLVRSFLYTRSYLRSILWMNETINYSLNKVHRVWSCDLIAISILHDYRYWPREHFRFINSKLIQQCIMLNVHNIKFIVVDLSSDVSITFDSIMLLIISHLKFVTGHLMMVDTIISSRHQVSTSIEE